MYSINELLDKIYVINAHLDDKTNANTILNNSGRPIIVNDTLFLFGGMTHHSLDLELENLTFDNPDTFAGCQIEKIFSIKYDCKLMCFNDYIFIAETCKQNFYKSLCKRYPNKQLKELCLNIDDQLLDILKDDNKNVSCTFYVIYR